MPDDPTRDHFAALRPFVDRHGRVLDAVLFGMVALVTLTALAADWPEQVVSFGAFALVLLAANMSGWAMRVVAWTLAGVVVIASADDRGPWIIAGLLAAIALVEIGQVRRRRRKAATSPT